METQTNNKRLFTENDLLNGALNIKNDEFNFNICIPLFIKLGNTSTVLLQTISQFGSDMKQEEMIETVPLLSKGKFRENLAELKRMQLVKVKKNDYQGKVGYELNIPAILYLLNN